MPKITCKTEDEVEKIISELQNTDPNLNRDEIINAIASCCVSSKIENANEIFIECVKERIKMLKII